MGEKRGALGLKQEVMDSGDCAGCGLCVGMCPYIKAIGERIAVIHQCGLEDGNCYRLCPRTATDLEQLDRNVFNRERGDHILGNHTEIVFARSLREDAAKSGQYGGVVSALTAFLLDRGEVSGAVLTGGNPGEAPYPVLARSREEVLACAGSRYSASPTLAGLNRAVRDGMQDLAVVGRPCQVLALRKAQSLGEVPGHNLSARKVNFIIGLFCFWSLETGIYELIKQRAGGQRILKVDIPREAMVITTGSGEISIPIEEVRPFVRRTCQQCFDPTAEFADVSVGSTEYDPRWNTLIVRSLRGKEIIDAACAAGVLEIKEYPRERLPLLLNAVRGKKLRVLGSLEAGEGGKHLILSDTYRLGLREERGVDQ